MNPTHLLRSSFGHAWCGVAVFLLPAALAAQHPLDIKPAPTPDPVKGYADTSPLTEAELQMMRTQRPPHTPMPTNVETRNQNATASGAAPGQVIHDACEGQLWAIGDAYKASFGADGFAYVPWFGGSAPRNFPVQFVLREVRVGGAALPLAGTTPQREGDRVTFVRGAVQERYELTPQHVEQTFVIDTALAGDVVLTLDVVSELVEDAATPGIQFGNEFGCVHYGDAHVVDGDQLRRVPTTWSDGAIRIVVPAAERTTGPLVIDPIIYTSAFSAVLPNDSSQPDIAYDAASDTYLLVWQYQYSATDFDIYCEFRNGSDGSTISGTLGTIDVTGFNHQNPRVANLASGARFLVVSQRYTGTLWQIYGRMRLAGQTVHPNLIPISEPTVYPGPHINPDVGGDPSASGDSWLVVWQREFSATDYDIHGRLVRIDTSLPGPTILIENASSSIYSLPSVSQSNGNGFATAARWMVVYQYRFSSIDWDVYGCSLNQLGVITAGNSVIDNVTANDLVPSVSSPNTDFAGGNPLFLVTYERQGTFEARARLLSAQLVNQIGPVNLSAAAFGLGPFWVRAESDGNRFVVLNGSGTISAATIGYNGSSLVLQEGPQALPGAPSYPRLCSKRSGGGVRTDYGIAYIETSWTPDRIGISAYRGHTPGNDVTRRVMGCTNLQIDVSGRPFLGEALTFALSNVGFDLPGFAFGLPVPASTAVCAPCPLGVSLSGVTLLAGPSLTIPIPTSVALVNFSAAVQGFALGSGPCVASLRFTDTIDFTVR